MKLELRIVIILGFLLIVTAPTFGEEYTIHVSRLNANSYQDVKSRMIIKTSNCFELAIGEDAQLIWDGTNHFASGQLIFADSGTVCQVDRVDVYE